MPNEPPILDAYRGIRRIALIIAHDNGSINRSQSEAEYLLSLDPVLGADGVYDADLRILDEWCAGLSDEDAETLGAGEHDDQKVVEATCPRPELCGLFHDIFEAPPLQVGERKSGEDVYSVEAARTGTERKEVKHHMLAVAYATGELDLRILAGDDLRGARESWREALRLAKRLYDDESYDALSVVLGLAHSAVVVGLPGYTSAMGDLTAALRNDADDEYEPPVDQTSNPVTDGFRALFAVVDAAIGE